MRAYFQIAGTGVDAKSEAETSNGQFGRDGRVGKEALSNDHGRRGNERQ